MYRTLDLHLNICITFSLHSRRAQEGLWTSGEHKLSGKKELFHALTDSEHLESQSKPGTQRTPRKLASKASVGMFR